MALTCGRSDHISTQSINQVFTDRGERESLDNVKEAREDIAVMSLTLKVREQMGGW